MWGSSRSRINSENCSDLDEHGESGLNDLSKLSVGEWAKQGERGEGEGGGGGGGGRG